MVEALISLMEPLITIFENRKSRRKQKWELIYAPMFKDISDMNEEYLAILEKAFARLGPLNEELVKIRRDKNAVRKGRREKAFRRQLAEIREQLTKDRQALGANWIKLRSHHNLRKTRRLKKEESAFMGAVLAYLSSLAAEHQEHTFLPATYLVTVCRPERATNIRDLRRNLRAAIDHHLALYRVICEHHATLQLAVLE